MNRLIIKNCNEVELDIPQKYALKLYEHFSVRHPNAFYLRRTVKNWDGKVHFISKYGRFKIGLLSRVYNVLTQEYNLDVEIIDTRKPVEMPSKLPKHIGKYKLRPEQIIHHINFIRTDNRISNLYCYNSASEHQRVHNAYRRLLKECSAEDIEFKDGMYQRKSV